MNLNKFLQCYGRISGAGIAIGLAYFVGSAYFQSRHTTSTWEGSRSAFAGSGGEKLTRGDRGASAAAFEKAAKVLKHPRCVNCHPAGDRPLVGDDSHPHPMHIERGPDGIGKNGLYCSGCHPEKNQHGPEFPPGAPEWQLPPASTPMVFEKKSTRQLCEQLKDPARNGSRTPEEIVDHVREAPLVLWGWHPGGERTPVPLPHQEFVSALEQWAKKGAACP